MCQSKWLCWLLQFWKKLSGENSYTSRRIIGCAMCSQYTQYFFLLCIYRIELNMMVHQKSSIINSVVYRISHDQFNATVLCLCFEYSSWNSEMQQIFFPLHKHTCTNKQCHSSRHLTNGTDFINCWIIDEILRDSSAKAMPATARRNESITSTISSCSSYFTFSYPSEIRVRILQSWKKSKSLKVL